MLDNDLEKATSCFGPVFAAVLAALVSVSSAAAGDDSRGPPGAAPGAAPSGTRVVGTWVVMESSSGARTGDKAEGTTYRFEEAGKVTVAGAKQCAYMFEAKELRIDCGGILMNGKIEFRDSETMLWTIGENERMTLKKR